MLLCLRLAVVLVVSAVVFSPDAVLAAKCKDKYYVISLNDSYLKKKYTVRAFFFYPGLDSYIYGIPKMPKGWLYDFPDEHGYDILTSMADTDKSSVDIGYFKDFFIYNIGKDYNPGLKPDFSMILFCNKPDGTAKILELETKDFKIKRIHKCLKRY
ncbi:MAG: hypothetical protein HQK99_11670 [Nitrospirae bacterium]|nr:hypothetical protein [Nitrospirota bacterium]